MFICVQSSGPCKKHPGYDVGKLLNSNVLGRSHRSKIGKERLKLAIDETKRILKIPDVSSSVFVNVLMIYFTRITYYFD